MVFSQNEKNGLFLTVHGSGEWEAHLEDGQQSRGFSGTFPAAIDPKALMCVKVSLRDGKLFAYVNQLEILQAETKLGFPAGLFRLFLRCPGQRGGPG